MARTLVDMIKWWARATPDNPAIVVAGEKLSFRDYFDWAQRIAVDLIARGLKPGDRVAGLSPYCLEYCALNLGVISAGGINVPLNLRFTSRELGDGVGDTTPRFVFAAENQRGKLTEAGVESFDMKSVAALRHGPLVRPDIELDPDAPTVIISTSGSTARPKGVVFTHRTTIEGIIEFSLEETACAPGGRYVIPAPMSSSSGYNQIAHYTAMGCGVYLQADFDPPKVLKLIEDEKITIVGVAPIFFERLMQCPDFEKADLSSVKLAFTGGAPCSRPLLDAFIAKGVVIRQMYGLTECGGTGTMAEPQDAIDFPEKCGRGRIFAQLRVLDGNGAPVPPNTPGEVFIKSSGTMKEYWNNPTATAEVMLPGGWLRTGDIGKLDEEGRFTFVDRGKDMIISGGLNVSPAEIERIVAEIDGVAEVAVIAAKDDKFGETPMAVIYATKPIAVEAVIAHCNVALSNYKVPRYVAFEAEPLPRNASGKISKPNIRAKYPDAHKTLPKVR